MTDIKELIEIPHLSDSKANDLIRVFMSSIGNSFLSYYQWHLNEAQSLARDHIDILQQVDILQQARPFFRLYGIKLENFLMGTFEDFDEWDDVCFRRTYIEAFNTMFGEIICIDIEDIEECMQQRKEDVSISFPNLIPLNTPKVIGGGGIDEGPGQEFCIASLMRMRCRITMITNFFPV